MTSIYLFSGFLLAVVYFLRQSNSTGYQVVNPRKSFEFTNARVKEDFMTNAKAIVYRALDKYAGKPFSVLTDCDDMIVLPNKYAHEVRNHPDLSFLASTRKVGDDYKE
jgi:hypothetical protein